MSKKESADKPKKGKGLLLKLVLGLALVGAGGGGAYALVTTGVIGADKAKEDNKPKLVRKGEEDPYAPAAGKGEEGAETVYGEGGSEYRTAYYSFEDGFTSNLSDSAGLVQVSLAASTRRDGRVIQWLEMHELAIRSAILVELANTPEDDVYSVEGKERLRQRLAGAINHVLEENEGFGGVEAVYFRSFLVQ